MWFLGTGTWIRCLPVQITLIVYDISIVTKWFLSSHFGIMILIMIMIVIRCWWRFVAVAVAAAAAAAELACTSKLYELRRPYKHKDPTFCF